MMVLSIVVFLALLGVVFYHRVNLTLSSLILVAYTAAMGAIGLWSFWLLLPLAIVLLPLNLSSVRRSLLSAPALRAFRKVMPPMSTTEKEAIDAGTTWWEGDLFRGAPDWNKLHSYPKPRLTEEEQAFIDGPVEEACRMANDFQITHELADLPPELWAYLKEHRFFAMIIKKEYGGLEFSPYAQAMVLQKLAGVSGILAITVGVPNSLGPGELLQHYGTEEQKNHYLPGLARGDEIPCFALTSPEAGSDAGAIPDVGTVCMGEWQGKQVLGMRLTWNKRYITLAPVATVLGLAFKLHDPNRLLSDNESPGITCALIPTSTPGVEIGNRHFPLNVPFQNGPTRGTDVFVPIDYIIGGPKMAGQGWRMLVECLSVGRGITLPSNSTGSLKSIALATGAYAHIRRQFKISIGKMEGIEEPLARGGHAAEQDNRPADQDHQRGDFTDGAGNVTEEGVQPADGLAGGHVAQAVRPACAPLRQRRRAGETVRGGPHQIAGDLRRIGEEQEGAAGQRRVEEVAPGAAEDLFGHHHAEGDAQRGLPQWQGRRHDQREQDRGDEETFVNLMLTDNGEQHFPEAADDKHHGVYRQEVTGAQHHLTDPAGVGRQRGA